MLKTFSAKTCAFDCEWVPCPATARRLLNLAPDCTDREAMEAAWARYRKPDDAPDSRPFLKLALSKVVSVAAVFRDMDRSGAVGLRLVSGHAGTSGEGELIRRFLEYVAQHKYQLWGFNSAASDLPILKQRAIALGVPCPLFSKRPPKPWEGYDYHDARNSDAHMDILELIGAWNGAAKPSLHELACACGVPGKLDATGGDVAEMYLNGQIKEIVEYNETDAVTTHLLMLRVALHAGQLAPDAYDREIAEVEQLVGEQIAAGKAAFVRFRAAWQTASTSAMLVSASDTR